MKSTTGGRCTALPFDVEARMAECIKTMERWGFGLSKREISLAIARYLKEKDISNPFTDSIPGNDYFRNFKKRHGLSQKKPQAVEVARKRSVNPFVMANYFELLRKTTVGLSPDCIYNVDETSFCLDPTRVKVVGERGKAAHRVTAGPAKENITVLMGANAVGAKLPPLIVFKGKDVWTSWVAPQMKEFTGTGYAATTNGYRNFHQLLLPAISKMDSETAPCCPNL